MNRNVLTKARIVHNYASQQITERWNEILRVPSIKTMQRI